MSVNDSAQNTFVVIGGTGNIGSAVVERLSSEGTVCSISRNPSPNRHTPNVIEISCDVSKECELRQALRQFASVHGRPKGLVYTPGLTPDPDIPLSRYDVAAWRYAIEVYVTGFLVTFQEALLVLKRNSHLVVLSSAVTRFHEDCLPPLFLGHYAAAKASLDELCKWGRREAHEAGVLLSRIAPAAVDVPYHRDAPVYRRPVAMVPMRAIVDLVATAILSETETDTALITQIAD